MVDLHACKCIKQWKKNENEWVMKFCMNNDNVEYVFDTEEKLDTYFAGVATMLEATEVPLLKL